MTFKEAMEQEGYREVRQMKNGEGTGILKMNYTYGLHVGLNELGYRGRYCYQYKKDAIEAILSYEGEGDPIGPWIKYKGSDGERLGPGAKEV